MTTDKLLPLCRKISMTAKEAEGFLYIVSSLGPSSRFYEITPPAAWQAVGRGNFLLSRTYNTAAPRVNADFV